MLRFCSGQPHLRCFPAAAASAIDFGDLVCLRGGELVRLDEQPTAEEVAASFCGVSHNRSRVGQTEPIEIDVSPLAIYEVDVTAGTYAFGDLLGPTPKIAARELAPVVRADEAIAIAAAAARPGDRRLRVRLCSTACHAGVPAG